MNHKKGDLMSEDEETSVFEMWLYRHLLRVSWTERLSNNEDFVITNKYG